MAKVPLYKLPENERAEIFRAAAEKRGLSPVAVEKDWWVSRTLEIVFQMHDAEHLVFKGGTSLSKVWKLIHRFSEDIDLAIDPLYFFNSSRGWTKKEITKLRKKGGAYTTGPFLLELQQKFDEKGFTGLEFRNVDTDNSDQDPRIIEIYYPGLFNSNMGYLLPRILLEIGVRSLREPFTDEKATSIVDEEFNGKDFTVPPFEVRVVSAERTFLEKLFLLHEEFHRKAENMRVNRLSRHIYDIYCLTKAGVSTKALTDKTLYETIVKHRHTFSKIGGVDYNTHNPKTLDPVPISEVIAEWEKDYTQMREAMIYDDEAPSFEELIQNLETIKEHLQSLNWDFELNF